MINTIGRGIRVAGTTLRILIGWHFLYEGFVKLADPGWSSAGYLLGSRWLFSGFFQSLAENPGTLKLVDAFNAWGLTLIGLALMLGLFTRLASVAGGVLLLLYFAANPPLPGFPGASGEGRYLIVNKNLIEMAALWLIAVFPPGVLWGLDRISAMGLSRALRTAFRRVTVPAEENRLAPLPQALFDRRELVKNLAVVPLLGGFVVALVRRHGWSSFEETALTVDARSGASVRTVAAASLDQLKAPAPKGLIGNYQISRLICGGNLISGFAHARDLIYVSPLLKAYFHDEKVMETLWLCESCGLNTAILRTDPDTLRILSRYWKRGGKIQWVAQVYPRDDDPLGNVRLALDNGAIGAFVQGGIADNSVRSGRLGLLEKSIRLINDHGAIAGTAGHMLDVVRVVEQESFPVDFYMKTLHRNDYWSSRRENQLVEVVDNQADNYWDMVPQETVDFMASVGKPWIAYKVLAAGAIPPKEGFRFAFENGADFACVGMFDFQIVENVNILNQVLGQQFDRSRDWMA